MRDPRFIPRRMAEARGTLRAASTDVGTTIRVPMTEIVREAVRLAVSLPRDPGTAREPRVIRFKPSLVVRQSTTSPRREVG